MVEPAGAFLEPFFALRTAILAPVLRPEFGIPVAPAADCRAGLLVHNPLFQSLAVPAEMV